MKSNCKYRVLHEAKIGRVCLCNSCGNLRIEIGHLMSMISPEPFQMILDDFKARRAFYAEHGVNGREEDPVIICLNNNNLFLKLTADEFEEVLELFEVSNHMLKVDQLLSSH